MQPVKITTLGEFSIAYGNRAISEKDKRSKKMWTLLKYLAAFRDRGVTQSELIDVLWGGKDVGNPAGALKTQLHRLRSSLDEALGLTPGIELVVSFSATYAFNDELEYTVDTVAFEESFRNSERTDISEKEQIGFARQAFEIYSGDFMRNSGDEKWVIPLRVYYRSIFIRIVHRLIDALFKHKQCTELINVCRKALQIDSSDQKIHILLIKALASSGERDAAKKHYKYVMEMLYNELGVNPLPELRELYAETIDREEAFENDLEAIKQKLKEDTDEAENSAFFCELEVFKNIYRLKIRDAERNSQKIQICLITVTDPVSEKHENYPEAIAEEMKKLRVCVGDSLRKSDIYARYSVSQFVIMLPAATDEAGKTITGRITDRYRAASPGLVLEFDFKHIIA
jgi:DNA-binding SARP family transcriptional activator